MNPLSVCLSVSMSAREAEKKNISFNGRTIKKGGGWMLFKKNPTAKAPTAIKFRGDGEGLNGKNFFAASL